MNITDHNSIGIIGLGRMGGGLALNMIEKGFTVYGYNRSREKTDELSKNGLNPVYSIRELVEKLPSPRVVWVMLTAGEPTQNAIFGEDGLINYLSEGDI